MKFFMHVRHRAGHVDTAELPLAMDGKGPQGQPTMNQCQAGGSTYRYAQRYLFEPYFGIRRKGEDDDAQSSGCITKSQANELIALVTEIDKFMFQNKVPTHFNLLGFVKWATGEPGKMITDIPSGKFKEAKLHLLSKLPKENL